MTNQHPITPPPELVKKIFGDALRDSSGQHDYELRMIHAAYAAGADQELEACLKWMESFCATWTCGRRPEDVLRAARRPKPPSLKEQVLADLDSLVSDLNNLGMGFKVTNIIRAIEQLPD